MNYGVMPTIFLQKWRAFSERGLFWEFPMKPVLVMVKSQDSRYILFKVNGNLYVLWSIIRSQDHVCVFTFSNGETSRAQQLWRSWCTDFGEQWDDGSADFWFTAIWTVDRMRVKTGVISYRWWCAGSNTVQEKFFIPVNQEFEKLKRMYSWPM